ncbi:TonB-dependent hemoglobin/transferrin/lactoferrin family receptor [Undibacterium sp. TS12]|uniref:TonB-dependent hemoglobin/transferrin/lactoferrin family receptor n=1 Tax=Undibacterium sp. TS12 TaxID=2908202 RepID=UPI001F4C7FE1|nr:TonB-dependent hemoglobin/transferrin/lactoferrin family receptor [Undibacterium sp. TS12]MCH8622651.1 TonB-dependent hemoglobin/transferrin/lactoferrin family receptor [Undibacterium sp. TS12]
MLCKTQIALALGMAWGMGSSAAQAQLAQQPQQAPVPANAATQLKEITVTSTRTERSVDAVPNTVTVIPAARIEQEGGRDIKDLFRNELDVSVRAAPARFTAAGAATGRAGNEGVNIRGLEGNQVLMMVDGTRLPASFSFGAFATGRGDFLELDGITAVEVLRGPTSTQFGSDGLAGAVSFRTLDPSDILKKGQAFGGFARAGYGSIDRSWRNTLAIAGDSGDWQGLLLASYRRGHETENKADNNALNVSRTKPNPVDYNSQYVLGKAFFKLSSTQQLGASLEAQKRRQDTEVYSARALPPLTSTSTIDLDTRDNIERNKLTLEHRYKNLNADLLQKAETRLYWQDAKVSQYSAEDRNTAADRTRDNRYQTKVLGLSSLMESNFSGAVEQRLSYGFDWSRSDTSGVRDGTVAPFGESFPAKPFPDTTYTVTGAFLQDEIENGTLTIIPGLRFDHYKLSPSSAGYSGGAVTALSDQAVTPRLGLVWQLNPLFAPYAQIAKGFRAPTPDQVNNGFTNLASGYTSIGNANLKAERADSIELGFRGKLNGLRYSFATFNNSYKDFISQQVVRGSGSAADPLVFQYINLAKAEIRGAEARAEWQIDSNWQVNTGIAYTKGDSETAGIKTPLDTINPIKFVAGLRYDTAAWGARAQLQHQQAKSADRIAPAAVPQFAPGSYNVVDLGVYWKPLPKLSINVNLNNVFDRKYWQWTDVRGLADNSTIKDAYTAPGRNAQVSVRYDF